MSLTGSILYKRCCFLVESLDLVNTTLCENLLEKGLITSDQRESIRVQPTSLERNRELISYIRKRYQPDEDIGEFVQALRESKHGHIADNLANYGSMILNIKIDTQIKEQGKKRKRSNSNEQEDADTKRTKLIQDIDIKLLESIRACLSEHIDTSNLKDKSRTVYELTKMRSEIIKTFVGSICLMLQFVSAVHIEQFLVQMNLLQEAILLDVKQLVNEPEFDLIVKVSVSNDVIQESIKNLTECNGNKVEAMIALIEKERDESIKELKYLRSEIKQKDNIHRGILEARPINPHCVSVSWQPVQGVTGYKVYCHPEDDEAEIIAEVNKEDTSTVISGLQPEMSYNISVKCLYENRESLALDNITTVKMPGNHHLILSNTLHLTSTNLELEPVLNLFVEEKLMFQQEKDSLLSERGIEQQRTNFVFWLQWRPYKDYMFFLKCLYRTQQNDLVTKLNKACAALLVTDLVEKDEDPEASASITLSNGSVESDLEDLQSSNMAPPVPEITNKSDRVLSYIQHLRDKHEMGTPSIISSALTGKVSKDSGFADTQDKKETGDAKQDAVESLALVLYPHTPRDDDELALQVKDVVTVIQQDQSTGWWTGELHGKQGMFPAGCVQLIQQYQKETHSSKADHIGLAKKVVALYDFEAREDDELTIKKGDVIVVLEERDDGWWLGYNKGKLGLLPSNYTTDLDRADEQLEVELYDNGWLVINKKPEEGAAVTLSADRWNKEINNIDPHEVEVVRFKLVKILCTEGVFDFLSHCENCKRLLVYDTLSESPNNEELARGLAQAVKQLNKLIELDVDDQSELSSGWDNIFKSISTQTLRSLNIPEHNLSNQGRELGGLLSRSSQLRWLGLNTSCMSGVELMGALSQIPHNSDLQGLLIEDHDLSKQGPQVVKVIKCLPKLRLLVISDCKLPSDIVCEVVQNLSNKIEILAMDGNNPGERLDRAVVDTLQQCNNLLYIHVSSGQFSPADLHQLITELSKQGTHVLVDAGTDHPLWKSYIAEFGRINNECIATSDSEQITHL